MVSRLWSECPFVRENQASWERRERLSLLGKRPETSFLYNEWRHSDVSDLMAMRSFHQEKWFR